MRKFLRIIALALALAAVPACASLKLGQTEFVNPIAAARTLDQRAYATLHSYAALLEEAGDIVANPATPISLTRALARAERAATPAVEALELALAAYLRSRDATAVARLSEAIAAAQAPITALQTQIRAR